MKHQTWKRVLSFVLAVLTVVGGLYIPDQSSEVVALEQDTNDYKLNKDFEDGSVPEDFTFTNMNTEVVEKDGSKVLALSHSGASGYAGFTYDFYSHGGTLRNGATLSYNVMYTATSEEHMLTLSHDNAISPAKRIARMENRESDVGYVWTRDEGTTSNRAVHYAGETANVSLDNNVWHSVKVRYYKDGDSWKVEVYLDGKLTDVQRYYAAETVQAIAMRTNNTTKTIYLDNIRVTENDHDAAPASFTALQFEQETYRMEPGDEIPMVAIGTPAEAKNQTVTYHSSEETVATVDEFGTVTALQNGTTTITASYDINGDGTPELTATAEVVVKGVYDETFDFESCDVQELLDNRWTATNGSISIIEDDGNHFLAFTPNDPSKYGYLSYALSEGLQEKYDSITLSYNILYTESVDEYLLTVLGGSNADRTNHIVRINNHYQYPFRWYGENTQKTNVCDIDTQQQVSFENGKWHTVKITYTNTTEGPSAEVYIDGVLTNIGIFKTNATTVAGIGLQMNNGSADTNRRVYIDNIRISEEYYTDTPPMLDMGEGAEVEVGKTLDLSATLVPDGSGYTVTYESGNSNIASVDPNTGVVTGVAEGEVDIKAIATKGETVIVRVRTITVKPAYVYNEYIDFENTSDVTDSGWKATNGQLSIKDLDGNNVLSFMPQGEKYGNLVYSLGKGYNNITLSYNIKYTASVEEFLLTLLPDANADRQNHIVRIEKHQSLPFRWYDGNETDTTKNKVTMMEAGTENAITFADNQWHTVKISYAYNEETSTQSVQVYIDGKLTNAGIFKATATQVSAIGLHMYKGYANTTREVLIDNIHITENAENADPTAMLVLNGESEVDVDSKLNLKATLEPSMDGFAFAYDSSDSTVAEVDANGIVTGVKAGTTVITVTATKGETVLVAKRTVTVAPKVEYDKTLDFEGDYDLGEWKATNGQLSIKDLDGNNVLSFMPQGEKYGNLVYSLGKGYNNITLSYNIKYTASVEEFLLTLLPDANADRQNHIVRIEKHQSLPFRWYDGNETDTKKNKVTMMEAGTENAVTFADNQWHTVKISYAYNEETSTQSVQVYIDGKLTNAGIFKTTATKVSAIGLHMYQGYTNTSREVLIDNIRITENAEINNPSVMLSVGGGNSVELGDSMELNATIQPGDTSYHITYETSDSTVATVDENGVVKGVSLGDVVITVTAKAEGKATITAKRSITVVPVYIYENKQDFEGVTADDLLNGGWDAKNGNLTIKDVDGNKVLSFVPQGTKYGYLSFKLAEAVSDVTLSYNIKYTKTIEEFLLTLLPDANADRQNHIVRVEKHQTLPFRWYDGNESDTKKNKVTMMEAGTENAVTFADNQWHTVKISYSYDKENGTQTVKVYIDGKLTNAGIFKTTATTVSAIGLQMYQGGDGNTGREVLLDNIHITEGTLENEPGVMLGVQGGNTVELGDLVELNAAMEPADSSYSITYHSSNPAVATVDEKGVVRGIALGKTEITITAKADGKPEIVAVRTIEVTPVVIYGESFDFENVTADALLEAGWKVKNGDFAVKTEDGNSVLSFTPQGTKYGQVYYVLPEGQYNLTLAYNIKMTGATEEYLPSLISGTNPDRTNHIVRMEKHSTYPFRWFHKAQNAEDPSKIDTLKTNVQDADGNQINFDLGVWHAVKIAYSYNKETKEQTVKVYIDGALTNIGIYKTDATVVNAIGLHMYQGGDNNTTREVLLDNIRISEENVEPVPVLKFPEAATSVELGSSVKYPASLAPAGVDSRYDGATITYSSSDTAVAKVSNDGVITPVARGKAIITATCKPKDGTGATLTAQVTVQVKQPGEVYIENFEGYEVGEFPEKTNGWKFNPFTEGASSADIIDLGGNKVLAIGSDYVNTGLYYNMGQSYDNLTLSYSVALVGSDASYYLPGLSSGTAYWGTNQQSLRLSFSTSGFTWWEDIGNYYPCVSMGYQNFGEKIPGAVRMQWVTVKIVFSKDENNKVSCSAYVNGVLTDALPTKYMKTDPAGMQYLIMSLPQNNYGAMMYLDNICITTNNHTPEPAKPIIPDSVTITSGKTFTTDLNKKPSDSFKINVLSLPRGEICKPELLFTSSNEEVATVDSNGLVTVKKAGTAVITVASAYNEEIFDTMTVIAKGPEVTGISVTQNNEEIESIKLPLYGNGYVHFTTAPTLATWLPLEAVSEDENIATVDQWGEILATGVGTTTLIFRTKDDPLKEDEPYFEKKVTITVYEPSVMKTIYVSPNGSSSGSGTAGDKVSIRRAMELIAAYNDKMTGNIVVVMDGGYYKQTSTIEFTQEHSGTNNYSVIWRAAEGQTPVIGGGIHLTGDQFKLATEKDLKGKGIYVVDVPEGVQTRQLFVNDVRATRARSEGGITNGVYKTSYITCANTEFLNYKRIQDLEFVYFNSWTQSRIGVSAVKDLGDGTIRIDFDQPGWGYVTGKPTPLGVRANPWYYENAIELLDEPGEWYLDEVTNKLYYMPRDWEEMNSQLKVTIPVLEDLVTVKGADYGNKAENIIFEGITFADTTWMRPSTNVGHADVQNNHLVEYRAATHRLPGAAIKIDKADTIRFYGCDFTRMGISAVQMTYGVQDSAVVGSHFHDISGGAINLGEPGYMSLEQQEMAYPKDNRMMMKNNDVINNYIHDVAVEFKSAAAVSVTWVTDADLLHNEIFNVPYSGFHIGYGWTSDAKNNLKNMLLAYNFIHDVMCEEVFDGGAIYYVGKGGDDDGTYNSITENYVRHQGKHHAALYTDGGSQWVELIKNVVDLSEEEWWIKPDGSSKVTPRWVLVSTSGPHKRFYGNYANTGVAMLPANTDFSKYDNIEFVESTAVSYCNPKFWPAAAKKIIAASGLEEEYSWLRNGQAERIVTNLKDELAIAKTFQVDIKFTDGKDREMVGDGNKVYYAIEDPKIATVDDNGLVTAVSVGTTKLTVCVVSNGILDVIESNLFVGDVLSEVKLDGEEDVVHVASISEYKQLTPYVVTLMGRKPVMDSIVYTSNDTNIVTVEQDGKIRPVSIGKTTITITITAEDQTISKDFEVEVSLKGDCGVAYGTPVIDGKLDDIYLESAKILYGKPFHPTPDTPVDIDGCAYLVWDEEYLYVHATVIEDSVMSAGYRAATTYMNWQNDAVEAWLMTSLMGNYESQFSVDAFGVMRHGQCDQILGYQLPYATAFTYNGEIIEGYEIKRPEDNQLASTTEQPVDGYVVEMVLPLKLAIGVTDEKPKAGDIITFWIQNNNRRTQDGYTYDNVAQKTDPKQFVLLAGEGMGFSDISVLTDGTVTQYEIGSGEDSIVLHCSGAMNELLSVEVDGITVDPENYTVRDGSTIVRFKSSFLETLSVGEHTVTLRYTNDRSVDVTISILAAGGQSGDQSGDQPGGNQSDSGIMVWVWIGAGAAVVVAAALIALILLKKKKDSRKQDPVS